MHHAMRFERVLRPPPYGLDVSGLIVSAAHCTIGPSCAGALHKDGHMTVWSHTQGAFPLRSDLAKVLGIRNAEVDVIHTPGSGCYGHNGADDVALDAVLVARAVPGRPVKL